jgi:hypothetical protein
MVLVGGEFKTVAIYTRTKLHQSATKGTQTSSSTPNGMNSGVPMMVPINTHSDWHQTQLLQDLYATESRILPAAYAGITWGCVKEKRC